MKYCRALLCAVALILMAAISFAGTVDTTTGVYGYQIAKGYTIYAKTLTGSASAEFVAATAGKRVKVIAYELVANGTVNVKFTSGGADDIHGSTLWYLTQNSGVTKPIVLINNQPIVYMQTGLGASLSINLSAAQSVSGTLLYFVE
jgi:hypothetical protein